MQQTRVIRLSPRQALDLEENLKRELDEDAAWRSVPHAAFSVSLQGMTATLYQSGKLVLQGRDLERFEARFLAGVKPVVPAGPLELAFDGPMVGADESGKGDYFGPLVAAAVFAEPSRHRELSAIGAVDSKTLADDRARRAGAAIAELFDHEIVELDPAAYNEAYAKTPNVNLLLARLHAAACYSLLARHTGCTRVLVDRFASNRCLADAFAKAGIRGVDLVEVPGGERNPVVAAASILARVRFLDGLARCQEESATDLPKGAGSGVDRAAGRVLAIGGRALLAKVAKVHFRNTRKAQGWLP